MNIVQMMIPLYMTKTRPSLHMKPTSITIHETGNYNRGANAFAHARLQENGNARQASWQYTTDDKPVIYQSLPDNEVGYHTGNGIGNRSSIGIEICVNSDGNFNQALKHTAWLVKRLMKQYNIPISRVVQHNHWSGKNCPTTLRKGNGWKNFIALIEGTTVTNEAINNTIMKLNSTGEAVVHLQRDLNLFGASIVADGRFGEKTRVAVVNYQKANGLVADGIVGLQTQRKIREMKELLQKQIDILKKEISKLKGTPPNKPSVWAEGEWKRSKGLGYFDGNRPQEVITRQESAIVTNRVHDTFSVKVDKIEKMFGEIERELKALKNK